MTNNLELDKLIKDLRTAITICESVESGDDVHYERTYPYATGYAKSCMRGVMKTLEDHQAIQLTNSVN